MDITFLNEYFIPVIVGICLCVGYVILIKDNPAIKNPYAALATIKYPNANPVASNINATYCFLIGGSHLFRNNPITIKIPVSTT